MTSSTTSTRREGRIPPHSWTVVKIIVLDTDVASRLQRGTVPLDHLSALRTGTPAITFVTVAEMFKGPQGSVGAKPHRAARIVVGGLACSALRRHGLTGLGEAHRRL